MERVFYGMTFVSLLIYLNDIIVFGQTYNIHLRNLEEVLKRLAEANLKLNLEKCIFFQSQVSFLGHLVSEAGIAVDSEKTKAVLIWPVPRNVSELRSFIGLCSYMRKFIHGFSSICKPLHALTLPKRPVVPLEWWMQTGVWKTRRSFNHCTCFGIPPGVSRDVHRRCPCIQQCVG